MPEEDMPDLFRRILTEADPLAAECVYLVDDEIKECLHWDELNISEEVKENLFALCKEFRESLLALVI